jgi:hypothetical protein
MEVVRSSKMWVNICPLHGVTSQKALLMYVTITLLEPSELLLTALFLFLVTRKDEVAVIRSKFPNKVPVSRN